MALTGISPLNLQALACCWIRRYVWITYREIVAKAASYNGFIRIDMEDSPCTDLELELFRKLKGEFPGNVGLVLQAYLKRTLQDIRDMMDLNSQQESIKLQALQGNLC